MAFMGVLRWLVVRGFQVARDSGGDDGGSGG